MSGSKRELFYSIRFNVDVPSSIHVQDVQKLLEEVGCVLANSTRDLIGLLSGESAAKFLADLAPFNIKYVTYCTGRSINELENGPSSYRQKGINFEWVFMK